MKQESHWPLGLQPQDLALPGSNGEEAHLTVIGLVGTASQVLISPCQFPFSPSRNQSLEQPPCSILSLPPHAPHGKRLQPARP